MCISGMERFRMMPDELYDKNNFSRSEIAIWSYKFAQTNIHILLERFPCCSDLSIMKKISIEALIEANTIKSKV